MKQLLLNVCFFPFWLLISFHFSDNFGLTLIGMGMILLFLCHFWIRFCWLNFYQKVPNFFEVKIDINQVILTPCPVYWIFKKLPLGLRVAYQKIMRVIIFYLLISWLVNKSDIINMAWPHRKMLLVLDPSSLGYRYWDPLLAFSLKLVP